MFQNLTCSKPAAVKVAAHISKEVRGAKMKQARVQNLLGVVLVSAFLLVASNAFAQGRHPVGPPVSRNSQQMSIPHGQLPNHTLFSPRMGGVPSLRSFD